MQKKTLIGNSAVLKEVNRVRLLDELRGAGSLSRADLSKRTGLDPKTVTNICNGLLVEKLVVPDRTVVAGRGRPAELLRLNSESVYSVGVDVGAQHISAVIVDFAGNIIAKSYERFSPIKSRKFITRKICQVILQLLDSVKNKKKIKGIGLGVPGFIDRKGGMVIDSVNFDGFNDFPVASIVSDELGYEVVLEESSRIMAIGELWFGDNSSGRDFIFVDAGFGIGMGIIQNGLIYRGANGVAGEIGHIVVEPNGKKCRCGNRGCLETVASGRALAEIANSLDLGIHGVKSYDAYGLFEAANMGSKKASHVLEKAGHSIGIAIANVVNLFDPGFVVLGGGLVNAGDYVVEPLKKALKDYALKPSGGCFDLKVTKFGEYAGAVGASVLPLKDYFEIENIRLK